METLFVQRKLKFVLVAISILMSTQVTSQARLIESQLIVTESKGWRESDIRNRAFCFVQLNKSTSDASEYVLNLFLKPIYESDSSDVIKFGFTISAELPLGSYPFTTGWQSNSNGRHFSFNGETLSFVDLNPQPYYASSAITFTDSVEITTNSNLTSITRIIFQRVYSDMYPVKRVVCDPIEVAS